MVSDPFTFCRQDPGGRTVTPRVPHPKGAICLIEHHGRYARMVSGSPGVLRKATSPSRIHYNLTLGRLLRG
jgi:hypothetical protein